MSAGLTVEGDPLKWKEHTREQRFSMCIQQITANALQKVIKSQELTEKVLSEIALNQPNLASFLLRAGRRYTSPGLRNYYETGVVLTHYAHQKNRRLQLPLHEILPITAVAVKEFEQKRASLAKDQPDYLENFNRKQPHLTQKLADLRENNTGKERLATFEGAYAADTIIKASWCANHT